MSGFPEFRRSISNEALAREGLTDMHVMTQLNGRDVIIFADPKSAFPKPAVSIRLKKNKDVELARGFLCAVEPLPDAPDAARLSPSSSVSDFLIHFAEDLSSVAVRKRFVISGQVQAQIGLMKEEVD